MILVILENVKNVQIIGCVIMDDEKVAAKIVKGPIFVVMGM
jgi:hypothetical protein